MEDHDSDNPLPESPNNHIKKSLQRRKGSDFDGFARPNISRSHSAIPLSPIASPPSARHHMKNSVSRANTPGSPYTRSPQRAPSFLEKENAQLPPFCFSAHLDRSSAPKRSSSYMPPTTLPLAQSIHDHGNALSRLSVSMLELPTFTLPVPNLMALAAPLPSSAPSAGLQQSSASHGSGSSGSSGSQLQLSHSSGAIPTALSDSSIATSSNPLRSSTPVNGISSTSSNSSQQSSCSGSLSQADESIDDSFLWDGSFSSGGSGSYIDYEDEETRVLHVLPTKPSRHPGITSVTGATVVDLMHGVYSKLYRAVHIIDLRYEYEFDGGHVRGAVNFPSHSADSKLAQFFAEQRPYGRDSVVVIYCEFSSERGPRALKRLRKLDRDSNMSRYPHLDFPYLYLLEGGYSQFFAEHRHACDPQTYIRMDDPAYRLACVQARTSQRVNKRISAGVGISRALSGSLLARPDTSSCPLP